MDPLDSTDAVEFRVNGNGARAVAIVAIARSAALPLLCRLIGHEPEEGLALMADERDERVHQAKVLREIADRIEDGEAPPLSGEVIDVLLREYSDRLSADSAGRMRRELAVRENEVDVDTATNLRAQLDARRGTTEKSGKF